MYFFLGLEARQRENTYNEYQEALQDACYVATKLKIPIRIFEMLPNNKSNLVHVAQPNQMKRPLYKKTFLED